MLDPNELLQYASFSLFGLAAAIGAIAGLVQVICKSIGTALSKKTKTVKPTEPKPYS